MRLWFCVCFLFCAYSVSILISEKEEVTYILENEKQKYDLYLNYSLCLPLRKLVPRFGNWSQTDVTINDLKAKLGNLSELQKLEGSKKSSNRPNNHSHFDAKNIRKPRGPSNKTVQAAEMFRSVLARNDFYIHMNAICFILNGEQINQTIELSRSVLSIEHPNVFVVRRRPFSFFKTELNYQLLLLNNDNEYSTCERRDRTQRKTSEPYSRFECTNRCLKAKRKSTHYFYPADDRDLADLNFNERPLPGGEQRICFEACAKDECEVDVFLPRHEIKTKVYFAQLMLSVFDYRVTFAGLISLFLNISIQEAVLGLTGPFLVRFRNKIKHFTVLFGAFRVSTLLICLAISSALYYGLIETYLFKSYEPARQETTNALLEIRPAMHLIICTPVAEYLNSPDGPNKKRKKFEMTFKELERATNGDLGAHLKGIYFSFLDEQQEVDLMHSPKVFFRLIPSEKKNDLFRCFKMQVNFKREARFRFKSLLLISKLSLEFEGDEHNEEIVGNAKLFLVGSMNESFTTKTIQFDGETKLSQYEIRKSRFAGKCADHKGANCTNRWNCIDVCVNRLFMANYSALSIRSVVDKDQFTDQQWSSLKPDKNEMDYKRAKKECEKRFEKDDCTDHSFKKSVRIGRAEKNSIQIDLHYELVNVNDEEQSTYKLALAILTIQSIFFGLNALKLVMIAVRFLQAKLKLNGNKIYTSLGYFICFICFLGQAMLIFVFIVDEELTHNQYFERPKSLPMPELVFCFRFDQSLVDENRRLTGNYLEEATDSLTASSIFESFGFLNASNKWIRLNMTSFQSDGPFNSVHSSAGIKIRTAFFQSRKCFYFKLTKSAYRIEQFYYRENGKVFDLHFTKQFKSKHPNEKTDSIRFFLKQRGTYHFSKMLRLNRSSVNVVRQELFESILMDRFGPIKQLLSDPLSLFRTSVNLNDIAEYTTSLLGSFKRRLRMATTSWPLKERGELFGLAVENELFEQYCRQVQAKLDERSPKNANYRRQFFINHFDNRAHSRKDEADFKFELLFFKKYLILTNSENWPKLLISLLNVLSIWLNVSVFELHEYFRKLTALLGRLYGLLLGLQELLRVHLD